MVAQAETIWTDDKIFRVRKTAIATIETLLTDGPPDDEEQAGRIIGLQAATILDLLAEVERLLEKVS